MSRTDDLRQLRWSRGRVRAAITQATRANTVFGMPKAGPAAHYAAEKVEQWLIGVRDMEHRLTYCIERIEAGATADELLAEMDAAERLFAELGTIDGP